MYTLYKSTDVDAPQMTSSAGTLLDVLDACLVNGYGDKNPVGWEKTEIDNGTYQALYTQGYAAGKAQRSLYVKDSAATPGSATAWACNTCTVAATPVLTNYFWTRNNTNIGILTKADQEKAKVSGWMVAATDRWLFLFTKRSDWGSRGWQCSFIGDLDSPYPNDKGCFAVNGFDNHIAAIALGGACREFSEGFMGVYGNVDGVFNFTTYTHHKSMGDASGYVDTGVPRSSRSSGLLLTSVAAYTSDHYRGTLPRLYGSVASLDVFSWYMLPDLYTIQNTDGSRSYLHVQFGGVTSGTAIGRVFLDITGAL